MGIPDHLIFLRESCMQVNKQQLEPDIEKQTGSQLGKEYRKASIVTLLVELITEYIMRNAGLDE